MRLLRWLLGNQIPAGFVEALADEEHILASAETEGGHIVVTALGLWIPADAGHRRIGWHLVSKAAWVDDTFTLTEADEVTTVNGVVILHDRNPVRFSLPKPGKVPFLIRQRVDNSIRARHRQELSTGGIWFVERKIPGTDGTVLQARPDPGVDHDAVVPIARDLAAKRPTYEDDS